MRARRTLPVIVIGILLALALPAAAAKRLSKQLVQAKTDDARLVIQNRMLGTRGGFLISGTATGLTRQGQQSSIQLHVPSFALGPGAKGQKITLRRLANLDATQVQNLAWKSIRAQVPST